MISHFNSLYIEILNKIDQLQHVQLDERFHTNTNQTIKLLSHGYVRSQNNGFLGKNFGKVAEEESFGFQASL